MLLGVALVGCAGLLLELVLTRLMSLTLYHHFAFLAISVSLLGISAGGVAAYLFPELGAGRIEYRLSWVCTGLAATAVSGFALQQHLHLAASFSLAGVLATVLKLLLLASPFFFVGLCIALALNRYPADAARVYGADLLGAGGGCLLAIPLLEWLGGSGALVAVAVLAAVGAWLFLLGWGVGAEPSRIRGWSFAAPLAAVALSFATLPWLQLYPPNMASIKPLVERWNAFSRVAVYATEDPRRILMPTVSRRYGGGLPDAKFIQIDSSAVSHVLEVPRADAAPPEYLNYDIAYTGFQLHDRDGPVLVIGPGGGKDVLAALLTGRGRITGVEVNPLIADLMRNRFGAYSGNLWERPGVALIVDEARSHLARDPQRYAFIHAALACTWAATAGGAFVLTENSLYTMEAFRLYLDRLEDGGILSMTMWYRGRPGELLRLVSLGESALRERGVAEPEHHMAVVTQKIGHMKDSGLEFGFGTFLLKKSAWAPDELSRLNAYTDRMGFQRMYAPGGEGDPSFRALLKTAERERLLASYPLDIRPPTDDRPFFFYQMRSGDFLGALLRGKSAMAGSDPLQGSVAGILVGLALAAALWVVLLLFLPLAWKYRQATGGACSFEPALLYFACIGMGFMLIEIPLLQRLTIFLGKPIFAFTVGLFTLLACAGLGSWLAGNLASHSSRFTHWVFGLLALGILAMALVLPDGLARALAAPEPARILIAVAATAPLGILLGLPLPMAIGRLAGTETTSIPLAWGINGGTSVLASVLAMFISINWGLTAAALSGLAFYSVAWMLWPQFTRSGPGQDAQAKRGTTIR